MRATQLRELVDVALSSPAERGLPFSVWSVPKLAEYCRHRKLLPAVSDEWVRRLLRREGLTYRAASPYLEDLLRSRFRPEKKRFAGSIASALRGRR